MLPYDERLVAAEKEILLLWEKYHLSAFDFEFVSENILNTMKQQPFMPSVNFTDQGIATFHKMVDEYNADEFRICFGHDPFPEHLYQDKMFCLSKEYWDKKHEDKSKI